MATDGLPVHASAHHSAGAQLPNCQFRRTLYTLHTLHTLHTAQERRDERDKPPVTSPSLSPPPRAPPSTRASLPPPPSHALGTALALQPVPERQALSTTLSSASAVSAQYGAQPGGATAFAAANSAFAAAMANGGGAGAGGLKATTVEAAGRRTARLLELQRVVWLSPFGGGSCLRVLWAWRETARLLGAKVRDETLGFDLDSTSIRSRFDLDSTSIRPRFHLDSISIPSRFHLDSISIDSWRA